MASSESSVTSPHQSASPDIGLIHDKPTTYSLIVVLICCIVLQALE